MSNHTPAAAALPASQLHTLISRARYEDPHEATAVINGHTFTVSYFIVERKCYDALPTPTQMIKVDGKRVSKKTAFQIAKGGAQ
jgi:hypothetical protein